MRHAKTTLVIALDSFDSVLAQSWIAEGLLPNLAALMQRSVVADVRNPVGLQSSSVWSSFVYGADPSVHGLHDGSRYFNTQSYRSDHYRPEQVAARPVWRILSDAGKRSVIIDAPVVPSVDNANDTVVIDWLCHIPVRGTATQKLETYPPELKEIIERDYGADPLNGKMCDFHRPRTAEAQAWFRDALIQRVGMKLALTRDLMAKDDWDFFLVSFAEAHCAGHHCWHLHDPNHEEYDPAIAAKVGNPLRDVYIAIDAAVGALLAQAGPSTVTMVYMTHGIQEGYTGLRLLDRILAKLNGELNETRNSLVAGLRDIWRALPPGLKGRLRPLHQTARDTFYNEGFLPHPETRKCFEIFCNERTSGIKINLSGREPKGIVQPGAECDALCERLIAELSLIRNDETGEPLVESIMRTTDQYSGPRMATLPDLLVTWNRHAPIHSVSSPAIGTMRHPHPTIRTGDHRPDGMFMLAGSAVVPRRLNDTVDVIDLAPTLAALCGLRPDTFQGHPLDSLLQDRQ
jgi:predicted AlkP superfamily phosphohydrolase/phosphomutase